MKGTLKIKFTKGKPTREEFQDIISMILGGYNEGIDQPDGINWSLETTGNETYDWLQEIIV
jgi:hypothetical protein